MSYFFVERNIARAKTLTKEFYTNPKFFEEAREKIFSRTWQFAGDPSLLQEAGDCYPFTLLEGYLDQPLLLTRNKLQQVNCLSNVCTHRGNILLTEPCKANNLRCKYHGRLFDLDGKFRSMPEFGEVRNFPSPADDLHTLPLHKWGNWLFTVLDKKITAKMFFKQMAKRIEWMPVDDFIFRPELSKEYHINAHWALYCENYLEGFHIPFVHADLNAVINYASYTTELFVYSNLQLAVAKDEEDCFELPDSSPDYGNKIAAYYFWVFPNMMFNFYPWGLSLNIVTPISPDHTKVSFFSYVWKEEKRNTGAGASLDKVELEDEEVVQNVQKGIRSRFYEHGRYSVTREQGTHHFHKLIAEFMK
ncbi:MAG: aromatic ring-hydroxylating dioxygenase subunit alpha [Chitinophagaceae bacterium]